MSARVARIACLPALVLAVAARPAQAEPAPAQTEPAPAQAEPAPAHLYVRADTRIAHVAVRPEASSSVAARCVAPCEAELAPGKYRLELDGLRADAPLELRDTRTAQARVESHVARRAGGLVALNMGGVIGVTMIAAGAFGGPSWLYAAGGGTLVVAGGSFFLLYRGDQVVWSVSPGAPADLDQPAGPAHAGLAPLDRGRFASMRPGLGFHVAF